MPARTKYHINPNSFHQPKSTRQKAKGYHHGSNSEHNLGLVKNAKVQASWPGAIVYIIPEIFEQGSKLYKNANRYKRGHEPRNSRILTIGDDESPSEDSKNSRQYIEDNGAWIIWSTRIKLGPGVELNLEPVHETYRDL